MVALYCGHATIYRLFEPAKMVPYDHITKIYDIEGGKRATRHKGRAVHLRGQAWRQAQQVVQGPHPPRGFQLSTNLSRLCGKSVRNALTSPHNRRTFDLRLVLKAEWDDMEESQKWSHLRSYPHDEGASHDVEKALVEDFSHFDLAKLHFLKWLGKGACTMIGLCRLLGAPHGIVVYVGEVARI
jgi:hypothetical protein